MTVIMVMLFAFSVSAEKEGDYTYTVSNNEATITKVNSSISAKTYIPSTLGGYPVTRIGYEAFSTCFYLTEVIMPDSVTSISSRAFLNCQKLESVKLSSNLKNINGTSFSGCTSLVSIYGNSYTCIDGVLFSKDKSTLLIYPQGKTQPSYVIPDHVTSIAKNAFYKCNLLNLTLSQNLESIENHCITGCSFIEDIYIPASVTNIEHAALECQSLKSIVVDINNSHYSSVGGVLFNKSLTELVRYPMKKEGKSYVILEGVTHIKDRAFYNSSDLASGLYTLRDISFPNSLVEIGVSAFHGCRFLKNVSLSGNIKSIGSTAFYNCPSLNKIEILNPSCSIYDNDSTIFEGSTIYGFANSTAESYAKKYSRNFVELSPHSHTYTTEITKEATHTEEGIKNFTCACGDNYTEIIPKLEGHTYTSKVTKEATHLEEGETTYTCACGDSYTEAIAKLQGHSYKSAVTAPTCTAKGYTTYTCECGDSYKSDYVATKPHSYSSTVTKPATHLSEGVKAYTCSACGDSYTEAIAKIAEHSYTVYAVIEPDCTNEGYTVYICQCGDSYNSDLKAETGHNYDGNTCTNCGKSKVENCSCNCHKDGIMSIIYKIMKLFWKLFGINKICSCGVAHY